MVMEILALDITVYLSSPVHLANHCPNHKNNMSSESTVQTSNKSARPLEEWKYCHPADLTKALPIYGKEWKLLTSPLPYKYQIA